MATAVYTVWEDGVFYNCFAFGVTESINGYGIALKLSSTNNTVNYVIIATAVYTVGAYYILYNEGAFGMAISGYYDGLGAEYFITYGTTYYNVIVAFLYTVGEKLVFLMRDTLGVTLSGDDDGIALKLLKADAAVNYAVIVTVLNTVRVNNVLGYGIDRSVTGCGINNVYARELIVTDSTVNYLVMITVQHTGGGNNVFTCSLHGSVSESLNGIIYIHVSAGTGMSGKATLGTCGSGNNGCVVMLSSSCYIAASELVTVTVDSYYSEAVINLFAAVSGNLETTDAVECYNRVGNVFIIAIYGVLVSAVYAVPSELHLSAFLVGRGYCDGQLTFAGQSVSALSTRGKSHSAGESNYESKYGYERAKLSE